MYIPYRKISEQLQIATEGLPWPLVDYCLCLCKHNY